MIKNEIQINKMSLTDLEQIKDELQNCFDDFWSYEILKQEIENNNSIYVVAKIDDSIVGFAGIKIIFDEAELMNIVVKKVNRKQGIGKILLKELVNIMKDSGINKIMLEVNENNNAAIKLYQTFGFEQSGKRKKYYNNIDDAILMEMHIN